MNLKFRLKISQITSGYLQTIYQVFFHNIIGLSTKQFLISVRMERAKQLLLMSEDPIKVVGQKVGIKNALYFSSAFKNIVDLVPNNIG